MKEKKEHPTPREKADYLYDRWGLTAAHVEAFEGYTFDLPPSKEYWKEVEKELKFFRK
jgi:hypothetical protein